jgi:two-component system, OmpR family, phosphate regulon sensor histidine kinase PhoR
MRVRIPTKTLAAVVVVAAAALLIVGMLISLWVGRQTYERIEKMLVSETRLVARIVSRNPQARSASELAQEARLLGADLMARVTLIAADGRVVGDSAVDDHRLAGLENHQNRPEVIEARRAGLGIARRRSETIGAELLYAAVRIDHPVVSVVRLALPLTEVDLQLSAVRRATVAALGLALLAAFVLAWFVSMLLNRRVNAIAAAARRYASGDFSRRVGDTSQDELGTVARVLDETVRELAERAAESTRDRARMEAILAGMTEGVLAVGAQGRVQVINRAAAQMLGLGDPSTDDSYLEAIRHPGLTALLSGALAGKELPALEVIPARNPERRLVARAAPVALPGDPGAVLVLHDITDLRHTDQVRRDFVANVSHELRTPLTAIRGYVEALRDEPADSEDRHQFLAVIERHVARMERLVRDLLRLASLEARQEAVDNQPCPLAGLFGTIVADLAPAIDNKGHRIQIQVEPAVATITSDPAKLQDALRNLVENAVNYSPAGSTISLAGACRDGRVLITVSDEGPGIPESDLSRIFERFYRVDKARSVESGGTGLGLSIVKHLVELLGGDVWAANRPGGGAIFTLSLPAHPRDARGPMGDMRFANG